MCVVVPLNHVVDQILEIDLRYRARKWPPERHLNGLGVLLRQITLASVRLIVIVVDVYNGPIGLCKDRWEEDEGSKT